MLKPMRMRLIPAAEVIGSLEVATTRRKTAVGYLAVVLRTSDMTTSRKWGRAVAGMGMMASCGDGDWMFDPGG